MPVTLASRLRQMQVFNLDHDACCAAGTCACATTSVLVAEHHPRTGERALRARERRVPATLTLLARERRAGLPDAVLAAPELRAAIARGHVAVVEQTPAGEE